MVHFDTSLLIGLSDPFSIHHSVAKQLALQASVSTASAVAWYEFLRGPITPTGLMAVQYTLTLPIQPFTEVEAGFAASLFNSVGRSRRFNMDAMIAAHAILAGAELATANTADFVAFVPHGLKLFAP
jgi:predicted nucleic acid-binding protein